MIQTENFIRVKEDIRINKWSLGSSITLKYKLFSTLNSKLFISIEKKLNQQQKSLEKLQWFKDHHVVDLQIDEIGYFGFILTEDCYLFRLPLGIFGIQDAKDEWNNQVLVNPEFIIQNYKQTWVLAPKLKEVQVIRLADLQNSNTINPLTKKNSQLQDNQFSQFKYLNLWRANDNKQYAIVAAQKGIILFLCLDSLQTVLAFNMEEQELNTMRLIETQSLSYLLVQFGQEKEYIQIILQKNNQDDKDMSQNGKKVKNSGDLKNIVNNSKSQSYLQEMIFPINNNGFELFISEEEGAIRLFFYCYKTKILKVYRPGNLCSSKYRFFIQLKNIIDIIQWKNYYVVFQQEEKSTKLEFFLKTTLQKCEKKTLEAPNFKPIFPQPIFSYSLYSDIEQIIKIDPFVQLSDRTFQVDIYKNNGVDILSLDLNHGKLELENMIHSDNFQITSYIYYELFLKNHQYDVKFCLDYLYQSLKAQQKWENLCLIDLQNKDKDPFKLFHEYYIIKSYKMEYLLFKSLLTAFDKVEVLEENFFDGFAFNILIGAYGIKMNSFEIGEHIKFKQMQSILFEQSLSPMKIAQFIQNQQLYSISNVQFINYIKSQREEESSQQARYDKKLIDFQELNLIFKQKRYAELVLNIISIVMSINIYQHQRERLSIAEILESIVIDSYFINETYFEYLLKLQSKVSKCPSFLKCLYLIMIYNQQESFQLELNYNLQKLNLQELFKLLNICVRNFKAMYYNKPFLNQNCIKLLLTKFYSLQLNDQIVKELIQKSLVQSKAESNFKDVNENEVQSYFNLIQKIYKQKSKLAQGSYQKYLPGIDSVWLILSQINKKLSKSQSKNHIIQKQQISKQSCSKILVSKQLSPKKKNLIIDNKQIETPQNDYILINGSKLYISNYRNEEEVHQSSHFSFQINTNKINLDQCDVEKKQQQPNIQQEKIQDINNQIDQFEIEQNKNAELDTLSIQIYDCIQQIQKLTSIKVKKIINPNEQIISIIQKLDM
ncbi:hypothetical protein TTHERM_00566910 (macronuclear) [Tetrahymena thermophila SB210]|uniref:Uncharacterized protein n=1 Tax=Tetrahymena thermophila (strain SB210) TaxID=312017 RepID=I7M9J0_TETTS|nr:hypothetical protein TTHERM_00566910 [Tetrahymena thermophila SB210]EAS01847.2 hypothetical protein TTHERM_00566910 [Tetrahymena thermophila SB210]|eukprot:XP_001022092.2 hypothetical protein TTHERM_00566910 [Tetrahymena thermophila SB210]